MLEFGLYVLAAVIFVLLIILLVIAGLFFYRKVKEWLQTRTSVSSADNSSVIVPSQEIIKEKRTNALLAIAWIILTASMLYTWVWIIQPVSKLPKDVVILFFLSWLSGSLVTYATSKDKGKWLIRLSAIGLTVTTAYGIASSLSSMVDLSSFGSSSQPEKEASVAIPKRTIYFSERDMNSGWQTEDLVPGEKRVLTDVVPGSKIMWKNTISEVAFIDGNDVPWYIAKPTASPKYVEVIDGGSSPFSGRLKVMAYEPTTFTFKIR